MSSTDVEDPALRPKPVISSAERVKAHLSSTYVSVEQIAAKARLTSNVVLDALDLLERQHGIGNYLDVSGAKGVSVRLRAPERSPAITGGAA